LTLYASQQSLIETVSADLPELNKTFRRVAQYMLAAPEGYMHKPVQEIAAAAEVSEPSVIRFCRRYGFKGIPDFRIALAMALVSEAAAERPSFLEPQITDSTKFRAPALHRFCEIERIHTIVTDTGLGDDGVAAVEARGVAVHRVEPIEGKRK
jgi:DeoR family galactitol utilization operon repressor